MKRAVLIAAALLLSSACGRSGAARPGDRVRLHYRAYADGKVYDTTEGSSPAELVIGEGALPAPVEAALVGMRPGDTLTMTVENAYGNKPGAENASKFPRRSFSALNSDVRPGQKILGVRDGSPAEAVVVAVDSATVTLSFDHPLAGKPVSFTLTLVSIVR